MEDPTQHEQASPAVRKRVQDSFDRQGLMSHLGARVAHIGPGRVHLVLPVRPEVTQQHGYVHAGATSAIADSAGGYAVLTLFDRTLTVCQLEVYGVQPDGTRKLVANGQQTLIRVNRPAG
ncbi:PaaI family thioesterase [Streptomyces sp. NBC_01239]|uniref:PaaI family thioesterase n=1 Tax=Streptomyces sp. NBC_01239 TaxID=2903792 RepID=UPI002253FBC2|nr:hotdog fold thioesterase [Streptomyces sp. NBC_01239]MCX4815686.1 PaaI family thioesterase [Streptomyces sp. NBC_01239]